MTDPISEDAARVLDALRKTFRSERVRISTALPRLISKLGLGQIVVYEALRDLHRTGMVAYQADSRGLPVSGYMRVSPQETQPAPHEIEWSDVLRAAGFTAAEHEALDPLSAKLGDFQPADMRHLAQALRALAGRDASHFEEAGPNVSARNLMGSAKVIAQLSTKATAALGLPPRLQQSSPRYVVCAGPTEPNATLLIENPRAFENAVRSGLAQTVALVCTYGFGLSYLTEELVETLTLPGAEGPIAVQRAGTPPPLDALLGAENVYLWGDLDRAAFSIYASLRRAIPQLAWSGLYVAMDRMLDDPMSSHPYAALFDKAGQLLRPVGPPDEPNMYRLWERCAFRAVDQEAVSEPEIALLGGSGIEMAR